MSLPFLNDRKSQSAIPVIKMSEKPGGAESSPEKECADELISAIHSKDRDQVLSALKALFSLMENQE
jgi:hypothetical protein